MTDNRTATFAIGTMIILLGGVAITLFGRSTASPLDTFAQCLGEKKAVFYGAFWCPHCQSQKALFGKSKQYLPYVECSTPDGKAQTAICKEKGVKSYPTWVFADDSQLTGEVKLPQLAEKTGCVLPQ